MTGQLLFIVVLVGVLYTGYFAIQSTELPLWENLLLNLANSTAWGISLELRLLEQPLLLSFTDVDVSIFS